MGKVRPADVRTEAPKSNNKLKKLESKVEWALLSQGTIHDSEMDDNVRLARVKSLVSSAEAVNNIIENRLYQVVARTVEQYARKRGVSKAQIYNFIHSHHVFQVRIHAH